MYTDLERYILTNDKACKILDSFKKNFIVPDYNRKNQKACWLLWCNLACKSELIPADRFGEIPVNGNDYVYLYSERNNEMYELKFHKAAAFIMGLKPWEDIDAEIFDNTYRWFIAVTHEDFCITYGL